MPFYEYECPKGHKIELLRAIKEALDPVSCKECGDNANKILTSITKQGIQFKKNDFSNQKF